MDNIPNNKCKQSKLHKFFTVVDCKLLWYKFRLLCNSNSLLDIIILTKPAFQCRFFVILITYYICTLYLERSRISLINWNIHISILQHCILTYTRIDSFRYLCRKLEDKINIKTYIRITHFHCWNKSSIWNEK